MSDTHLEQLKDRYGERYKWYATFTAMVGTMAMSLSSTIINVALPGIMEAFQVSHTDVQWLADPRNAEKVRIVDMRSADAYKAGHIPGAVLLDAGAHSDLDQRVAIADVEPFLEIGLEQLGNDLVLALALGAPVDVAVPVSVDKDILVVVEMAHTAILRKATILTLLTLCLFHMLVC